MIKGEPGFLYLRTTYRTSGTAQMLGPSPKCELTMMLGARGADYLVQRLAFFVVPDEKVRHGGRAEPGYVDTGGRVSLAPRSHRRRDSEGRDLCDPERAVRLKWLRRGRRKLDPTSSVDRS